MLYCDTMKELLENIRVNLVVFVRTFELREGIRSSFSKSYQQTERTPVLVKMQVLVLLCKGEMGLVYSSDFSLVRCI